MDYFMDQLNNEIHKNWCSTKINETTVVEINVLPYVVILWYSLFKK